MDGPHDRLIRLLDDYEAAKRALVDALTANDEPISAFRNAIRAKEPVGKAMANLGTSVRRRDEVYAAMRAVEAAMLELRAEGTRLLVDEEGFSISEVARLSLRSRQFTTRLYRRAKDATDG